MDVCLFYVTIFVCTLKQNYKWYYFIKTIQWILLSPSLSFEGVPMMKVSWLSALITKPSRNPLRIFWMIQTLTLFRYVVYPVNRTSSHPWFDHWYKNECDGLFKSCLHNIFTIKQKFKKDPYTTTLGGFSKVTNYLFDAFRAPELECQQRPAEEVADLLGELIPGLEINQQEEPGFEVITRVSADLIPALSFT